jgi:hypothetical protein
MMEEENGDELLENALRAVRRLRESVAGPGLRTLQMRYKMSLHALQSAGEHRDELLTENKKLRVVVQELAEKLDAMRNLLGPVRQG